MNITAYLSWPPLHLFKQYLIRKTYHGWISNIGSNEVANRPMWVCVILVLLLSEKNEKSSMKAQIIVKAENISEAKHFYSNVKTKKYSYSWNFSVFFSLQKSLNNWWILYKLALNLDWSAVRGKPRKFQIKWSWNQLICTFQIFKTIANIVFKSSVFQDNPIQLEFDAVLQTANSVLHLNSSWRRSGELSRGNYQTPIRRAYQLIREMFVIIYSIFLTVS